MAVLSLTWKSPYVDKTVFILRRGPVVWAIGRDVIHHYSGQPQFKPLLSNEMIDQSHKSHNALSHISQYTIQNRNAHNYVLNCDLWKMEQVHCEIC